MSSKRTTIIQLDKKTITKIAAGEVVERPASVVKELVENSLDAFATVISVFIKGHGLDEITIVDNGIGMSKEDAALSWKSHTTSKLKTITDLASIESLGFRGEALASIASVSMMEIVTRKKDQSIGTIVRIKGGELELFEEKNCRPGTIITIRNLFYNVPARKKFLKSKTTELGHIIEIVTRQALIRPNIHFKLQHDKSILLNSPKSSNTIEPFIAVFGIEMTRKMIPVLYKHDGVEVSGFTSMPDLSRSTRDHEMFYVNKRFVKNKILSEGVEEAYKTLLMKKRYPVTLLNIELETSEVDVNIHPTKREVRFGNASKIFDVVKNAISEALSSTELWRDEKLLLKGTSEQVSLAMEPVKEIVTKTTKQIDTSSSQTSVDAQLTFEAEDDSIKVKHKQSLHTESRVVVFSDSFWMKPLGQALNLYALCETNEGIAVVDIHAAHERVRYEQLTEKLQNSKLEIQELLQPITFQLTSEQIAFLKDYLHQFKKIGINFELFGGKTYIVRSLPVSMDLVKTENDIKDFIDEMRKDVVKIGDINERIDLILKTMACHSVVRGGDAVDISKILSILFELKNCKNPFTCPHGRPTIIKISEKTLEKEFGRIV